MNPNRRRLLEPVGPVGIEQRLSTPGLFRKQKSQHPNRRPIPRVLGIKSLYSFYNPLIPIPQYVDHINK